MSRIFLILSAVIASAHCSGAVIHQRSEPFATGRFPQSMLAARSIAEMAPIRVVGANIDRAGPIGEETSADLSFGLSIPRLDRIIAAVQRAIDGRRGGPKPQTNSEPEFHLFDGEEANFAYGSNVSEAQMAQRCPTARLLGRAELPGHRFLINGRGVATVVPNNFTSVHGLLWALRPSDVERLDAAEGVRHGTYKKEYFSLRGLSASVYIAANYSPSQNARPNYLEKIVAWAFLQGFPVEYIREQLLTWSQPAAALGQAPKTKALNAGETAYFAYGSNMIFPEMIERCPGARWLGNALLSGHRFILNENGLATLVADAASSAHGVLWSVTPRDVEILDWYESIAVDLYRRRMMTIDERATLVYLASNDSPGSVRQENYLEKIIFWAAAHGMPDGFIRDQLATNLRSRILSKP